MKKNIFKILKITLISIFLIPFLSAFANTEKKIGITFTGIGCPHCAKVSPELHRRVQDGSLILIEYEMYKTVANSQVFNTYIDSYKLDLGVPQLMFDGKNRNIGDTPIINNIDEMITKAQGDRIYLSNGDSITYQDLNLNSLSRYPIIYSKDRAAVRYSITTLSEEENIQIKNFIFESDLNKAIEGLSGKDTKPELITTPSGNLKFENALKVNGWLLQWNGESLEGAVTSQEDVNIQEDITTEKLSLGKLISLGLADSVNPCALSILALVLISIITYNPGKRKDILLAGLAFVTSVLIMYLLYGVLIVKAFSVIQSIGNIREFLFGKLGLNFILGIVATILGILGLKDFISYKPGSVGTEMPMFLRPKVNKIVAKVTSPFAAFGIGLFVTIFLLPCTIGPYIILGGLLSSDGVIKAIPSLLLYNLIFVLPMLSVTLLVYFGTSKVEDVKDWKDKNVRYMHLISGVLLLVIGILMLLGKF